jgi:hypothetical protein
VLADDGDSMKALAGGMRCSGHAAN